MPIDPVPRPDAFIAPDYQYPLRTNVVVGRPHVYPPIEDIVGGVGQPRRQPHDLACVVRVEFFPRTVANEPLTARQRQQTDHSICEGLADEVPPLTPALF